MASTSKLQLYVLPLFIPLSLAVGRGVALVVARGGLSLRTVRATSVVLVCLFVAGKAYLSDRPSTRNMEQLSRRVAQAADHPDGASFYLLNDRPSPASVSTCARRCLWCCPRARRQPGAGGPRATSGR